MTLLNPAAVPATGPMGRPAHVAPGSVTDLPGADNSNLPPTESLSPAQLTQVSAEATAYANQIRDLIAEAESRIEAARRSNFETNADMPRALREQRAAEHARAVRKKVAAEIAPRLAELLAGLRQRVARLDAQAPDYSSPLAVLQAHAFADASLKFAPAMAGCGPVALAQAYRRAYQSGESDVWFAAAVLSRLGQFEPADYNRARSLGVDRMALARRTVGQFYTQARDAIRAARLALKDAEAAEYAFRESKPLANYALDAGMQRAGHHNDEFRD